MLTSLLKHIELKIFSLLFILALFFSLFYNGSNIWLFSATSILITLCFAIILKQWFFNSIAISINGVFVSSLLLLIWFAISIFLSPIKYLSLHNFFWLGSIIIVFIIFTLHKDKEKIWNNIWLAIILLVTIWAIWGLIQHYFLYREASASFLNRNTLSALINLALIPASGYFLLGNEHYKLINNKIFYFLLFILFLATFIITSRGGALSLSFGFIILLFFMKKRISKIRLSSFLLIVFISFIVYYSLQYFLSHPIPIFTERMISLKNISEAGNPRFIMWNSLLPLFKDMPWYGLGLGSLWVFWAPYRPAGDDSAGFFAHNDYMQITLEAGYPGIILLLSLFLFVFLNFIKSFKNHTNFTLIQRVELISLFSTLTTYAAHSIFTYNFYIAPLLIIAGLYLARFNQLISINTTSFVTLPALKKYFNPYTYVISAGGTIIILCSYFLSVSFSNYYNIEAKKLMQQNKFQESDILFLKAQKLSPLIDNPFFSHANLLQYSAYELAKDKKHDDAKALLVLAHEKLDHAEKLNPLRPETFHIRGIIYKEKQPEKAIVQFEKVLNLDPHFLHARIQLAILLHKQNKLTQALSVMNKGLHYKYHVSRELLNFLQLYANYSRETGNEKFALYLESEIQKIFAANRK